MVHEKVGRQQALALLRQHLTANIVRLRRQWCCQSRGIAQGSTLSTLLCRWGGNDDPSHAGRVWIVPWKGAGLGAFQECLLRCACCCSRCCSLYLAHLERTQLAGLLSGRPQPQVPPAAAHTGMQAPAAAAAAAANVISLGVGGGDGEGSVAHSVSGGGSSRGLLSELARAADTLTSGGQSGLGGSAPAGASAAQQQQQQRARRAYSATGGPVGDLLLLPAGVAPSASALGAGAVSSAAAANGGAGPGAGAAAVLPSPLLLTPASGTQPGSRLAAHAGSLLMRLVDDFLLVTGLPAVAQGFAASMLQGKQADGGGGRGSVSTVGGDD